MWVGLIQSAEDLNRTKRQEGVPSARGLSVTLVFSGLWKQIEAVTLLEPQTCQVLLRTYTTGSPSSQDFGLRPELHQ